MLRNLFTLLRGATHTAAEEVVDRNALMLLQQQIRDSAATVSHARRAVAIAIAQNKQAAEQHEDLVARIDDLEARTLAALEQGKEDLAQEGAEVISRLEAERTESAQAQQAFQVELARLKENVRLADAKLRNLQRGQRLAQVRDKTLKLRSSVSPATLSSLSEAEATLSRLQEKQHQMDLTAEAMEELAEDGSPGQVIRKLAEAGCGDTDGVSPSDVLDRLRSRMSDVHTQQIVS